MFTPEEIASLKPGDKFYRTYIPHKRKRPQSKAYYVQAVSPKGYEGKILAGSDRDDSRLAIGVTIVFFLSDARLSLEIPAGSKEKA